MIDRWRASVAVVAIAIAFAGLLALQARSAPEEEGGARPRPGNAGFGSGSEPAFVPLRGRELAENESQRPQDDAASPVFEVRVVDEGRQPVSGADVQLELPSGSTRDGKTNATGTVAFEWDESLRGGRALARHPAHAVGTAALPNEPATIDVVLREPASIIGGVVLANGHAPWTPVTVAAVPATTYRRRITIGARIGDILTRADVAVTATDSAGRFEIRGLRPEMPYAVLAGAPGLVANQTELGVLPGGPDVEVTVFPVYAIRLVFEDAAGSPARTPNVPTSGAGGSIQARSLDAAPSFFTGYRAGLVLAGLQQDDGPPNRTIVLVGEDERQSVGPVIVSGSLPGYAPFEVTLTANRIGSGPLASVVRLVPEAECFADVTVRLTSVPRSGFEPFGKLVLESIDRSHRFEYIVTHPPARDSFAVANVPCGSYEAYLEHPIGNRRMATPVPCHVDTPTNEIMLPSIDAGSGAIEIIAFSEDGSRYWGDLEALFGIHRDGEATLGGTKLSLAAGHPRMENLPPGSYDLVVLPYGLGRASSSVSNLIVTTGETTTVQLILPAY